MLFILCDDLRSAALGCYGSAHVKTPRIDEGIKTDLPEATIRSVRGRSIATPARVAHAPRSPVPP